MNSKPWMIIAVVLLVGAGLWALLRPPEPIEPAASAVTAPPTRAAPPVPSSSKLAAASVLAIDPRARPRVPPPSAAARRTVYGEYLAAKQLRGLYDRLKNTAEGQTAEGLYTLYEIARRCATVSDRPASRAPIAAAKTTEQRRDEFYAALQPNDPARAKRVAAFEDVSTNRCLGFDGVTMTQADLAKMLTDAVNAGDPKARAYAIEQDIMQARRVNGRWDASTLSDSQIESLKQIIGTRDPAAMLTAGRLLSNSYTDITMRLGPDGQVVEPRVMYNAWQMLSCDYGYPCGEDNQRLLTACAYQSHCDATSLQDYLYYYASSPHDSQLLAQYRDTLRVAIETGDWSQLTVTRGARPPGAPIFRWGPS